MRTLQERRPTEKQFRDKQLRPILNTFDECWYFVKEAKSLRGIPDVIGVYKGKFFALEVKKNKSEAAKKTGRICLQKYITILIQKAGGFASFIYPENLEEVIDKLKKFGEYHP